MKRTRRTQESNSSLPGQSIARHSTPLPPPAAAEPLLSSIEMTDRKKTLRIGNSAFSLCFGFILALWLPASVFFVEGAAAIRISPSGIPGFRLRGPKKCHKKSIDNDTDSLQGVETEDFESSSLPRKRESLFRLPFQRNVISAPSDGTVYDSDPIENLLHKQGISLMGMLLAGSSSFGGSTGGFAGRMPKRILGTMFRHPKWLLVGGVVYQGQKALRSEAFRRATKFWCRVGPLVAHYKFTKWWLKTTHAPLAKRDSVYAVLHERYAPVAEGVALDLQGLYVKLAQVASSRPDFVPLAYISRFVQAQDSLPQWPIDYVTETIDRALKNHESSSLSFATVFEDIDEIALGSASIGQCHRARIKGKYARELLGNDSSSSRDNSSDSVEGLSPVSVAVKVMHPGAEDRFRHDFSVFRWLCKVALKGWEPILDECYRQIMSEFDYQREANSLETVRNNMKVSPFAGSVRVPKPVLGLCSRELLVMELLDGDKLSDSLEGELEDILGEETSKKLLDRKRLELVLGKEKLQHLESSSSVEGSANNNHGASEENLLANCGWSSKLRLLGLYKRAQSTIDTLVDVQGYQMLKDGVFQGDPHPGNILELSKNKKSGGFFKHYNQRKSLLGLIDYGQTKAISDEERLGVARVILALGEDNYSREGCESMQATNRKTEAVASAMRDLGFVTKNNNSEILEKYAGLFFDSDEEGRRLYDCATPQSYFKLLTELDPLQNVPDVAVFVARCGFLLRGMGSILGKQIKTSQRWSVYAKEALEEAEALENVK